MKLKTALGVTLGGAAVVAAAPYILSGTLYLLENTLWYAVVTPWRISHMSPHVEVDERHSTSTRDYYSGASLTKDPEIVAWAQRENMPRLVGEDGQIYIMAGPINPDDEKLFNDGSINFSRNLKGKNGRHAVIQGTDDHFDGSVDYLTVIVDGNGGREFYKSWKRDENGGFFVGESFEKISESDAISAFSGLEEFSIDGKINVEKLVTSVRDDVYDLTEADEDPLFKFGEDSGIELKGKNGTDWTGDWKTMTVDGQGNATITNGISGGGTK